MVLVVRIGDFTSFLTASAHRNVYIVFVCSCFFYLLKKKIKKVDGEVVLPQMMRKIPLSISSVQFSLFEIPLQTK